MVSKPELCSSRFSRLLSNLVNCRRIKENVCDRLIKQYDDFLVEVVQPKQREFTEYDSNVIRLDQFLKLHMVREDKAFESLWGIVKQVLILSHGQAAVERGFSINKSLLVDNVHENTIGAQRIIHDYVQSCGGIQNVKITKEIISAAKSGRKKYNLFLEEQKKEKVENERSHKRKLDMDRIHELERKRVCLEQDVKSLLNSADKLSKSAEKKGNMLELTKSNSFRRTAKDKQSEIDVLNAEIKRMQEGLC